MWAETLTNPWESLLLRPMQGWLAEHPLLGWLLGHPLWLLGLVVVGLLLFAGLWSAIARLTEGFWLALVQFPFRLSNWIFGAVSGLLVRRWVRPATTADGRRSPGRNYGTTGDPANGAGESVGGDAGVVGEAGEG
jgi:hypothetical protein